MTKWFLRLFTFLLFFQVDVKVNAAVVELPKGCVGMQQECSVQARTDGARLVKEQGVFTLSESSILKFNESGFEFLQGLVWVQGQESFTVGTLFGEIVAPQKSSFWVLEEEGRIYIKNQGQSLEIRLRDGRSFSLVGGFEVWIAGIGMDGKNLAGAPSPLNLSEQVSLMARYYKGEAEGFKSELNSLKSHQSQAVQMASQAYQQSIERKIASAEEAKRERERAQEVRRAEKQALKDYFFWRTFMR